MVSDKEFNEAVEYEKLEELANDMTNKILFENVDLQEPNGDINPQEVFNYIIRNLEKVKKGL